MSSKEVEVIVFDLNGTFYNKSSKDEFYKFVYTKKPKRLLYYFQMLYYKLMIKLKWINQTEFKENFFNYLDGLPPEKVDAYAREFWQEEFPREFNKELLQHFKKMKQNGVKLFCATGGLEIYVKPLFELFEIDGIAGTVVKYENGTYIVVGEACKNKEKLKRLEKHFDGKPYKIIEAYSDSEEDILDAAEKAFLIKDGKLTNYNI